MILTKKLKDHGQALELETITTEQNAIGQAIQNEIECPRCYDTMTLCSDFDSLYYVCESCDFYLYTIKK
jgi:hypothetical protein